MSKSHKRASQPHRRNPSHKRRPQGVSRRQRKRLGFESLEDRRVMSAQSPLESPYPVWETTSYSSATPEGQQQILLRELEQYFTDLQSRGEMTTNSIPTDPLLGNQWHLINSGQQVGNPDFQEIFGVAGEDINVAPVWAEDLFGTGVVVAVVDTGVQLDHPDLIDNIHPFLGLDALTQDGDPSPRPEPVPPEQASNGHGTAVAGIIAAMANNGMGGTGIAPGASIVPVRLIDDGQFEQAFVDTFRYATDQIDITNNSWGPGAARVLSGPSGAELLALRDSVLFGREGNGVIHVFSSGNDGGTGLDSSNYNGWVNSRYTIGVTGVDHTGEYNNVDGTVTDYPEAGSSVLVAAPTGSVFQLVGNDTGIGSGIITSDLTGDIDSRLAGYNYEPDPDTGQEFDRDYLEDGDYTSRFNGTSASAPMVSGVIALMLEANPNLSWRDVQEILVRSARQNAKLATQANGTDKAVGNEYQSTWITNQVPLFHDPDDWDPQIPPSYQQFAPILDPLHGLVTGDLHYAPTPQVLTNAAGYTVSQGRGTNFGEDLGWAHGVVDAELAVKLAQQWHTKNQALPDELSFTTTLDAPFANNLPAAEIVDIDPTATDFIVPGGLGGGAGFSGYWQEYWEDDPFADNPTFPIRGLPTEFSVPSPNDMTVETVEVTVTLTGGNAVNEVMDNLRITLVSPNGTHSELNHYYVDGSFAPDDFHQADPVHADVLTTLLRENGLDGVSDSSEFRDPSALLGLEGGDTFQFTFSTNRNWGERSDDAIVFDPTTGEPIFETEFDGASIIQAGNLYNGAENDLGTLLTQGWQLHFENYSTTELAVGGIDVTWHGSPIAANSERVQGFVGLDDNRDGAFNYSRVNQVFSEIDGDPTTLRLGEVQNVIDPNQEDFAENVTVVARRASDGAIVDRFVTGHDGNFYFDLVPDDYIISIEDPEGRLALEDSFSPNGVVPDYAQEWAISEEWFKVWDYDANLDVAIDSSTGAPEAYLDGLEEEVVYGMKGINFLIDPGAPQAEEVNFTGVVFADINGDGNFNGDDVVMPNVQVFGDVNRNGQFDSGEIVVQTNADGEYDLTVPSTSTAVIDVGVIPPVDWTATSPDEGLHSLFTTVGSSFEDIDFGIQPPAAGQGNGTSQVGNLLGVVFDDVNGNSTRQSGEQGAAGLRVYLDANNNSTFDAGETQTITNSNGAFAFSEVAVGQQVVRVDLASPLEQTRPVFNGANIVNVPNGGTISGITFGVENTADLDFGDLPDVYHTTLNAGLAGGARHKKGVFFLGENVDTELSGVPSAGADSDSFDDGIEVTPLEKGGTGTVTATASRNGGYLQAWIDFNNDGDFDDVIDGVSEQILTNELLNGGVNSIDFEIPATIDTNEVYARFRYGSFGNDYSGEDSIGEVEDYVLEVASNPSPSIVFHGPDFNEDGDVDGFDFLALQRGMGTTGNAAASNGDSNGDGNVDAVDMADWKNEYGQKKSASSVQETGDFNLDGRINGSDFLAWQRGVGTSDANVRQGDSNQDGDVDGDDLAIWNSQYGGDYSGSTNPGSGVPASVRTVGGKSPTGDTSPTVDTSVDGNLVASVVDTFDRADVQVTRTADTRAAWSDNSQPSVDRDVSADVVDLGLIERDRALDRLFASKRNSLEELSEVEETPLFEDALSAVLEEEIDWRLV